MDVGSLLIHGSLHQTSANGIQVGSGTSSQRPTSAAGLIRYNTDLSRFETNNGAAWANVGLGDGFGSVTSVSLTGVTNAITVTGSPVTASGTFALSLAGELAGINALATTGLVSRTATGTYTPRTIAADTTAGLQGFHVTNGDGVAGAPTLGITITGLTVANAIAAAHTTMINDGTNNTKASFTQIATYLDTLFISQAGDTMTGFLTLNADPTTALEASTKSYVDNSIATAISTDTYTAGAAGGLTLTAKVFTANTTGVSTGLVSGSIAVRSTASVGQILHSTGTAGAEATWGALDLTNANAVTGSLGLLNGGTGATTAAGARTALVVPSIFRVAFTNATLVSSLLTVTHSLGQQFVHVMITDNTNSVIQPDNIAMTSTSVSTIDLTSFGTITGTWNVVVIG